jgi:hypothetical protein
LGSINWSGGASHMDFTQYGHVDIVGSSLSVFGNIIASNNVNATTLSASGNVFGGNISSAGNVIGNNISAGISIQLPIYADDTARDAAISSPQLGMFIINGTIPQIYNGASWGNITLT